MTQEQVDQMAREAAERAYFCKGCSNWQLKASHPGRCPADAPFVDVSTITEYGLTQKLSNAVRVF